jgi:RNA polymerase sigma-70 factor (ECF subfamily)
MSVTTLNQDSMTRLVQRAQSGDRDAFDDLVVLFESRIYGIVMQRLRNTAEADEVVQEVFLRAFRKLPQLQEPERFGGWLCQIAVRLSINRAVRRPNETCMEPNSFDGVRETDETPFSAMIRQENIAQVREGLNQLGRLDRETLWAFYFEGASLKEMSEQFESPIGTIKRRLHTARGRLRDVIGAMQPA